MLRPIDVVEVGNQDSQIDWPARIAESVAAESKQCTSSIFTAAILIERLRRTVLFLQANGAGLRCGGIDKSLLRNR